MKSFLLVFVFIFQIGSAVGDQRSAEDPISVTQSFKDGVSVRVSKNEHDTLSEVVVTYAGISVSVAQKYLKNITNPILGTVYVIKSSTDDDSQNSFTVSLEFENRPYNWGYATRRVAYHLRGGELQVKEITTPVAKGEYEVFDEFKRQ